MGTTVVSSSIGFFEVLLNGLWPTEEDLDRAEQERLARKAQTETQ